MLKLDDTYHMKIVLIALATTILISACGRPERKVQPASETAAAISKDSIITKHRAFNHFSKADLYERSGNLEGAADEYRLALVYDPTSDELKRLLARVYLRLKRYDEAIDLSLKIKDPTADDLVLTADLYSLSGDVKSALKLFRKAVKIDSTMEKPNRFLADYYGRKGDLKKAEKYYRRLIEIGSNSLKWRLDLASFFIQTDQFEKAVKIYQEMIDNDSLDNRGYLGIAAIREMQSDTSAADSLYRIIANKNWHNPQILTLISQSFIRLNDIEMALDVTRRIVELFPDDYFTKRRYALLLFSNGDHEQADSVLWQLSSSVADDPIVFYYLGRIAQTYEKYARAESMYVRTLAIDDTLTEAWVNLAFIRAETAGIENAQATFDTALVKCPPDSLDILLFSGMFFSRHGIYVRSIEYYNRALMAEPENINVMFNLAAVYERSGNFEKAEDTFIRLLELEPDNHMALNYLGYMYADRGIKLNEAKKMIERALKFEPDNGAYLDSYAWVLYKRGKYEMALKYQQKALEVNDDDAILFDHMGDIYSALNQYSKAQDNWRRALELDPDNEAIKMKLAK